MNIAAGIFKAECLKLMDRVKTTHEEIVISKHGKPVARLVPVEDVPEHSILGMLAGTAQLKDDLVASTGEVWNAAQ
jgi:prevent-host-death family protein